MSRRGKKRKVVKKIWIKYRGVVDWFAETGTEGAIWVLEEDGKTGYEALVLIEEGDRLKIFAEDGSVLFVGVIKPDYKIGWTEYPKNPGYGQPSALGYWIHWTQTGWKPDDWAKLFIRDNSNYLRAELYKNPQAAPLRM